MREKISILLISIAIIGFQLAIVNVLSYSQWHHFAYLAVSIAMLGFGSSGVIIAIWRNFFLSRILFVLPILFLTTGLSMILAPLVINSDWLRFDTLLLFSSFNQLLKLFGTSIILFIPFVTGALAIGLFFTAYNHQINKLYAYNLGGSALGGVLMIWLSNELFPMHLASIFGLAAVLGAPLIRFNKSTIVLTTLTLVIGLLTLCIQPSIPFTSQYKPLSKALLIPDTEVSKQTPLSKGTFELITSNSIRQANGLSLNYIGKVPLVDIAFLNAQPYFAFEKEKSDSSFYQSTVYALPYLLNSNGKTSLHIQPSSTFFISLANVFGYTPNVIEPIEFIADSLTNYPLLYGGVNIKQSYPRQILHKSSKEKWDIISFPTAGNTGNSGLNALMEDYLFTTNTALNSFNLLEDGGFLVLSSVMDNPARSNLKLISLATETLRTLQLEPHQHMLSIRTWNTLLVMIKRSPLNLDEISNTREFCKTLGFDLVHPYDSSQHNILMDENFQHISNLLIADSYNNCITNYPFNLRAPSDNSPYFSQFVKLSHFKYYINVFGFDSFTYLELGYFIVWVSFIICLIISLVAIIIPSLVKYRSEDKAYWIYLYFSSIGLAYMMLEVVFIQKSILTLNNPIMASSIVISSLLCFSAVGSYLSSIIKLSRIPQILFVIGLYIILYSILSDNIINHISSYDLGIRILCVVVTISPLAFFMGMVFPIGMRMITKRSPNQIPIAWGVNGFFSVLAAPLATITAVEYGFYQVLAFSAILYMACIPLVYKRSRLL
jgi:hypothetical protein